MYPNLRFNHMEGVVGPYKVGGGCAPPYHIRGENVVRFEFWDFNLEDGETDMYDII
jgi:hypothetical protein